MSSREIKETLFLQSINRQEPHAYKELYVSYYRALVLFSLQYVARSDVAEDIVQDLFVTMWNKKMAFLSFPSFQTYLYNSVRNASLDYLKHNDIKQRYAEQFVANNEQEIDEDVPLFDDEIYRRLYRAIDELPSKCREIFLMAMDGKRNEEIAEMLQIAVETVKTQKKRAIKHIRKQVAMSMWMILLLLHK